MNQNDIYEELLAQLDAACLEFLSDKPEETPESTLRALWLYAGGEPVSAEVAMRAKRLPELTAAQLRVLRRAMDTRLKGVPLSHITGRQSFMGIELLSSAHALVPRKETELLGNRACDLIGELVSAQGDVCVIDVCTGAGNLPVAYAKRHQAARIYASDLSVDAVELARRNVVFHGLESQVALEVGDLMEPYRNDRFLGKVDILTCNPPYISSGKVGKMSREISEFEPRMAFDGGAFGIRILERLIKGAPELLRRGGYLLFEVGQGQGGGIQRRLEKSGLYRDVAPLHDENGSIRAFCATVA